MLKFGKNIAGKERLMLTITGTILVLVAAWILGTLFMPKNNSKKIMKNKIGVWMNRNDTGFTRMEIKANGYFYYDVVFSKSKSLEYKGLINEEKEDTILLISFNADTIVNAKILELSKDSLVLQNLNNNRIIIFLKN